MALLKNGGELFHKAYVLEAERSHVVKINGRYYTLVFPVTNDPIFSTDNIMFKGFGFGYLNETELIQLSELIQNQIDKGNGRTIEGLDVFIDTIYFGEAENAKKEFESVKKRWEIKFNDLELNYAILSRCRKRYDYLSDLLSIQRGYDTSDVGWLIASLELSWPEPEENWDIEYNPKELSKSQQKEVYHITEPVFNYYFFSPIEFIEGRETESNLPKGHFFFDPLRYDLEERLSFILYNNFLIRWEKEFLKDQIQRLENDEPIVTHKQDEVGEGLNTFQKLLIRYFPRFWDEGCIPEEIYRTNLNKEFAQEFGVSSDTAKKALERLRKFFEHCLQFGCLKSDSSSYNRISDHGDKQRFIRYKKEIEAVIESHSGYNYMAEIKELRIRIENLTKPS